MKLLAPTLTFFSLKDELETSALISDKPSETRVPVPIFAQEGRVVLLRRSEVGTCLVLQRDLKPIARR
jgi:hypothetical protein